MFMIEIQQKLERFRHVQLPRCCRSPQVKKLFPFFITTMMFPDRAKTRYGDIGEYFACCSLFLTRILNSTALNRLCKALGRENNSHKPYDGPLTDRSQNLAAFPNDTGPGPARKCPDTTLILIHASRIRIDVSSISQYRYQYFLPRLFTANKTLSFKHCQIARWAIQKIQL